MQKYILSVLHMLTHLILQQPYEVDNCCPYFPNGEAEACDN